jgi:putative ABC transport system ATP-binding protein
MSGGQQQRVAIARALAPRPLMVLADEPTANLDTANGEQVMEIMKRLNEQTGTAFVFATHDPRVMAHVRRVVKLQDGQVIDNGNLAGGAINGSIIGVTSSATSGANYGAANVVAH